MVLEKKKSSVQKGGDEVNYHHVKFSNYYLKILKKYVSQLITNSHLGF